MMNFNQNGWASAGPEPEHDTRKCPAFRSRSARMLGGFLGKACARKGHLENLNTATHHFADSNLDASVLPWEILAKGSGECDDTNSTQIELQADLAAAQEYSTPSAYGVENDSNVLGYLLLGVLVGMLAAAGSLFLGASIIMALGVYCAVGACITFILPLVVGCTLKRWDVQDSIIRKKQT